MKEPRTSIVPASVEDLNVVAKAFAQSGYFPGVTAQQAFVRLVIGQALGLDPLQAMTGIYVVKGRISFHATTLLAMARRAGYDYDVVELSDERCVMRFYRWRGNIRQFIGESVFTIEDARRAGIAEGENWKKYPRNMLFARAAANGVRWFCPDAIGSPVLEVHEAQEIAEEPVDVEAASWAEEEFPFEPASEPSTPEPFPQPSASSPSPTPKPTWDWTAFWKQVREQLGMDAIRAVQILRQATGGRYQSFADYAKAGHSMEDGLKLLREALHGEGQEPGEDG